MHDEAPSNLPRFRILSLDGGGIKGLFSAAVIASIEEDYNIRFVDHFDLIAGTSTGGIIALALGFGLTGKEIVEFYVTKGPKIFAGWSFINSCRHWFRRKYSSVQLERALKQCFGEKLFGQSLTRLVIPCYNIGEDAVYLFRTPHHDRLRRDFRAFAWQVASATSAAPTYLSSHRSVNEIRLVDGGVWANNPIMVALVEAYGTLEVPLSQISILSIGTTDEVACRPKRLDTGGRLAWARDGGAIDVILRGQSLGAMNQARFLVGEENVRRLNPAVPSHEYSLDGVYKADALIAKAHHYSRSFAPSIRRQFLSRPVISYTPAFEEALRIQQQIKGT